MNAGAMAGGAAWAKIVRLLAWGGATALLLTPLVAMQFTDEVKWGPASFIVAGTLLYGCAALVDRATRTGNFLYVAGSAVAIGTGFLLVWVNLAVGMIGDEDNPANLMFFGVVALAVAGAAMARFRAAGMARAMAAAGVAQGLAAAVVAVRGLGADEPPGTAGLLMLIGGFAIGWLLSALLYWAAARSR